MIGFHARKRLQRVFGWIILLALCAGTGYGLARLASAYMPKLEQRLANLGPAVFLVIIALIAALAGAGWLMKNLACLFDVNQEKPLAILCAAFFGLPATIVMAVGFGNGVYGAWSGACYIIAFAVSSVVVYAAMMDNR